MKFEDWYETHFGDQPTDLAITEPDYSTATIPAPPGFAGGGAESNLNRRLWEYQPPVEQLKTQALAPDFAPDLPQVAAQPLPSPPYSGELNYAGKALQELVREAREGTGTSPEALEEVRNNPTSLRSLETYGQWLSAIMMGGKGGEKVPLGPKGAVPEHIWQSWKVPNPDVPTVRVDNAGNYYEMSGIHKVGEPGDPGHTWHAIVKPVENPDPVASHEDYLASQYTPEERGEVPDPPYMPPEKSAAETWQEYIKENPDLSEIKDLFKDDPDKLVDKIWDEWAKKHGGLKPDFEAPPPYASEHPVTPEDLADFTGKHGPPEEPPTLKDIYDDLKANPEKSDFWNDLPGPKYIEGRGMAMPYSDEGEPLLPPPPDLPPDPDAAFLKLMERWNYKPPPE